MLMSVLWFLIWAMTVFSTYQTVTYYALILCGRGSRKFAPISTMFELIAAFGWGWIIVFWMN